MQGADEGGEEEGTDEEPPNEGGDEGASDFDPGEDGQGGEALQGEGDEDADGEGEGEAPGEGGDEGAAEGAADAPAEGAGDEGEAGAEGGEGDERGEGDEGAPPGCELSCWAYRGDAKWALACEPDRPDVECPQVQWEGGLIVAMSCTATYPASGNSYSVEITARYEGIHLIGGTVTVDDQVCEFEEEVP